AKFNGRYDDPAGLSMPKDLRFRTVYCGTRKAVALGEIIDGKGLRPSLQTIVELPAVDPDRPVDPSSLKFYISEDWRSARWLETARLNHALRFANVDAPETPQILGSVPRLAHIARELQEQGKIHRFDQSAITSQHRELTQAIARYVYELVDDRGHPLYAGLHYSSGLNHDWECWAVFDKRIQHESGSPGIPEPISPDDPELREVARVFRLPIEIYSGKVICPWCKDDDCDGDCI
ncbi:MAG: hypothetical protein WCD37_14525, partial [Chloroflexia bacterium]